MQPLALAFLTRISDPSLLFVSVVGSFYCCAVSLNGVLPCGSTRVRSHSLCRTSWLLPVVSNCVHQHTGLNMFSGEHKFSLRWEHTEEWDGWIVW